jgi:hypothetical protein
MSNDNTPEVQRENIRLEYSEIGRHYAEVAKFRFSVPAFYLAAIALLTREEVSTWKSLVLMVMTIFVWFIDLRNRYLVATLLDRGKQIETKYWGYPGLDDKSKEGDPGFFTVSRQNKPILLRVLFKERAIPQKLLEYTRHANALDGLFIVMLIIAATMFVAAMRDP